MSLRQPHDRRTHSLTQPVLVGLLVLVAAAGVYARAHTSFRFDAPPRLSSTPVTIAFAVIEALGAIFVLCLALSLRRRRKNPEEEQHVTQLPGNLWLSLAITTTVLAMLLLLAYWLIRHFRRSQQPHQPLPTVGSSTRPTPHSVSDLPAGAHTLWLVWLGGVALTISLAVAVALWRRRRERTATPIPEDEPMPDIATEAMQAGRRALDTSTDPRTAVIACYEAMERSLADAGVERTPAQTPEELLTSARRQGAVTSVRAAESLVDLFGRARFSARPVDPAHVAAARNALTELLRDTPERVVS